MEKVLIIIGLILTAGLTLPIMFVSALFMYDDWRKRPDAPPPSKDDWKVM